jgi:hypothetical protein
MNMKNMWILMSIVMLSSCSKYKEQPVAIMMVEEKSNFITSVEEKSIDTIMPETYIDVGHDSEQEEVWTEEQMIQYYSSRYPLITNETCRRITILLRIYQNERDWGSGKDKEMIELLLDFLRKEENWSINVENELPLIKWSVSEDDMVRIYNWEFELGATGDIFNTIIQYKSESGSINAVYISGWGEQIDQFRQLGFRDGNGYRIGFKIEEQTYLIYSYARAGGAAVNASFLAVRLLDGKIEPYLAFNGDNYLELYWYVGGVRGVGGIIENVRVQFDNEPFSINVFCTPSQGDNESQNVYNFTFNGTEFLGNYSEVNEIANYSIW